ncbi:MAG TPA: autotransporter-associated beta strand repeat-containing protein [Stenotrophomonas sp.]
MFGSDADTAFAGAIDGDGGLRKQGAGTLLLSGIHGYSGGTEVLAGNLQGSTTSLQGAVANQATVTFDQASEGTYDGAMTGTGTLRKINAGTLRLTGDSSAFAGNTLVDAGRLIIGIRAVDQTVLGGNATVAAGAIIGGHGTLTGDLQLAAGAHLAPGASVGTLTIGGDASFAQGSVLDFDFGPAADAGVGDGARVGGNLTFAGTGASLNIADAGAMRPGVYRLFDYGGTLSASGSGISINSQPAGMTFFIQNLTTDKQINLLNTTGAMLNFWNANGLADANGLGGGDGTWTNATAVWANADGSLTAPMQPQPGFGIFGGDAGTVTIAPTAGPVSATGLQFLSDGYSLQGDPLTLVADANGVPQILVSANATATISNVLAGSDGLVKAEEGTLVLSGNNTYAGDTRIEGGVLSVAADSALGLGGLAIDGGTLRVTGTSFSATPRAVTMGDLGAGLDIADAGHVFMLSQALGGLGALHKSGAGTLVLAGANTYSGGTDVAAGILRGDGTSLQGDIRNQAVLDFAQATDGDFGGVISGNGSVQKHGAGTLWLTGSNRYLGGTWVAEGTLRGDSNSLTGDIVDDATLWFDQVGNGRYEGAISGSGAVRKSGAGTLVLTGGNSYDGGTTVEAGVLQGDTVSLQGNIANAAFVVFDQSADGIYAGALSGAGQLLKRGGGQLVLTGDLVQAGGVTIEAGALQVGAGGTSGTLAADVAVQGLLAFDRSDAVTFGGVISGDGALLKTGAGTLTLTGANLYGGGTRVEEGLLRGDSVSLQGNIDVATAVEFAQAGDGVFAGEIAGAGEMVKTGAGTLQLSGENRYSGGTQVLAGTLSGDSRSLQGDIDIQSALVFDQASDGNYNGTLSGGGTLTKTGAGGLRLTANNQHTGGTLITEGVLSVALDAALGANISSLTLAGGTLKVSGRDFDGFLGSPGPSDARRVFLVGPGGGIDIEEAATRFVIDGVVSGDGALVKTGVGTLALLGRNVYTGGTTVREGVLEGNSDSIVGDVGNDAVLLFAQHVDGTYAGVVGGGGQLRKQGAGVLVLSGVNTYSGGTVIEGGTLQVTAASLRGAVQNDATIAFEQSADDTFSGAITGSGQFLKGGAGNLRLTGDNRYSGGTVVSAGTLSGNSNSLQGDIDNRATVDFAQDVDGTYQGRLIGGGLLVKSDVGALFFAGDGSGYSGVTQLTSGALIVGPTEGSAAVLAGQVFVQPGAVLGGHGRLSGDVQVAADGHVAPGNSIGTLSIDGNAVFQDGSVLDFEFGAPGADFSVFGSGDSLQVGGDLTLGTVSLNVNDLGGMGAGLYNVFRYGGTLQNTGFALGSVPEGMALQLQYLAAERQINLLDTTGMALNFWNADRTATAGNLGGGNGTWALDVPNWTDANASVTGLMAPVPGMAIFGGTAGVVQLSSQAGALSAAGLQFVSDGYLLQGDPLLLVATAGTPPVIRVGDGSAAGADWQATIASSLGGTSGLVKADNGTLVLTGENTYAGGTWITGGVLSIDSDGRLGAADGALTLDGGVLQVTGQAMQRTERDLLLGGNGGGIDVADPGNAFIVWQALSGSGALTKSGAGLLVLSGANTYTGGTVVTAGTLQGDAASLQGAIDNQASLVFSQPQDGVFVGTLAGSGSVSKNGAGGLLLTGMHPMTGPFTVAQGTLRVGDLAHPGTQLAAPVTVQPGATLAGTGGVAALDVAGTVAPGEGIGILSDAGDLRFLAGSLYAVDLAPNGASDLLRVGGRVSLQGGNVQAFAQGTAWSPSTRYTLISGSAVEGRFDGVQSNLLFLDPVLSYTATTVELALLRNDVSFASVADTPNQRAVAIAADALGWASPVYIALTGLDGPQARDAFDQLSGEMHASLRTALFDDSRYVREAINGRLASALDPSLNAGDGLWAASWKHWSDHDGDGNAARLDGDGSGLVAGADFQVRDRGRVGVLAGFGHSTQQVDARRSSARIDATHLGLYGSQQWNAFALRGGIAYAWQQVRATRQIVFPGFAEAARSEYGAHTAQAYVEGEYALQWRPDWAVAPFLNLAQVQVRTASFVEQGADSALRVAAQTDEATFSNLGVRLRHDVESQGLRLEAAASWAHAFQDVGEGSYGFTGAADSFAIAGVPLAEDAAAISLTLGWEFRRASLLTLGYRGVFASDAKDQSVEARVQVNF